MNPSRIRIPLIAFAALRAAAQIRAGGKEGWVDPARRVIARRCSDDAVTRHIAVVVISDPSTNDNITGL